jgi:hypothetical protein
MERLTVCDWSSDVCSSDLIQNNADNAKGWQTKVEGGTAYIGEIHIQQGQQPKI